MLHIPYNVLFHRILSFELVIACRNNRPTTRSMHETGVILLFVVTVVNFNLVKIPN